jgi:ArsR family transcriptional regulator
MNKLNLLKIFNALSDPTRLDVLIFLQKNEKCSCEKILSKFKLAQPTMSHHLSKLVDAQLVVKQKVGVSNYYYINSKTLKEAGLNLNVK